MPREPVDFDSPGWDELKTLKRELEALDIESMLGLHNTTPALVTSIGNVIHFKSTGNFRLFCVDSNGLPVKKTLIDVDKALSWLDRKSVV